MGRSPFVHHLNVFLPFQPPPILKLSTGEVPTESRPMAEANTMATFDRPPVIERLHNNVGKRKSTTPQKFVGRYNITSASQSTAFSTLVSIREEV